MERTADSRWTLKANTFLVERDGDLALFHSLANHVYVKSPLVDQYFENLCSQLKLVCRFEDLWDRKDPAISAEEIYERLALLEKNHLLVEFDASFSGLNIDHFQESILSHFYSSPPLVLSRLEKLSQTEICVIDLAGAHIDLESKLKRVGFSRFTYFRSPDFSILEDGSVSAANSFWVAIGSWENTRELQKLNEMMFDFQRPWLLIFRDSYGGQIGPYFSGVDSPCFECLHMRKASLLKDIREYGLVKHSFFGEGMYGQKKVAGFPLIDELVASHASIEIFKLVTDLPTPRIRRGAFVIDGFNLKSKFNELFPIPFCPVCSGIDKNPLGSIRACHR